MITNHKYFKIQEISNIQINLINKKLQEILTKAAIIFLTITRVAVIIVNNKINHNLKIINKNGNPQIFINNILTMIFLQKKWMKII